MIRMAFLACSLLSGPSHEGLAGIGLESRKGKCPYPAWCYLDIHFYPIYKNQTPSPQRMVQTAKPLWSNPHPTRPHKEPRPCGNSGQLRARRLRQGGLLLPRTSGDGHISRFLCGCGRQESNHVPMRSLRYHNGRMVVAS